MGNNFRYVCYRFGYTQSMFINPNEIMNVFDRNIKCNTDLNVLNRCTIIKELLDVRDGYLSSVLNTHDINELLLYVCND